MEGRQEPSVFAAASLTQHILERVAETVRPELCFVSLNKELNGLG